MIYTYDNLKVNITTKGNGEPVFLLHGWGCNGEIFKSIQEVLATAYTVLAIVVVMVLCYGNSVAVNSAQCVHAACKHCEDNCYYNCSGHLFMFVLKLRFSAVCTIVTKLLK